MFTPNIDEKGADARRNASRIVLVLAALVLFLPGLSSVLRWGVFGVLIAAGLFMRFEAKKRWCVLRACGIKTSRKPVAKLVGLGPLAPRRQPGSAKNDAVHISGDFNAPLPDDVLRDFHS